MCKYLQLVVRMNCLASTPAFRASENLPLKCNYIIKDYFRITFCSDLMFNKILMVRNLCVCGGGISNN